MMKKLRMLIEKQLKPNWTTILIGWEGPGKYPHQITPKEVIDYATELATNDDNQPESVWMLAGANENDMDGIGNLIRQLAQSENADRDTELRKWRVVLVEEALSKLSSEPLYGLIGLTELWEKFDYPIDSPHVMQGINNNLSPKEYYTQGNYNQVIERHRKWIESEFRVLRNVC